MNNVLHNSKKDLISSLFLCVRIFHSTKLSKYFDCLAHICVDKSVWGNIIIIMLKMMLNPGFYIGSLHIKWYGVIIAASMVVALVVAMLNAPKRDVKRESLITAALITIPLAIIGARLFYVAFYAEHSYSFVEILRIWDGGNAIYGGLIGGAIGIGIYCLVSKKNFFAIADIIVPALILAQALGRWGNFVNQEAYGYAISNPNLWWFPFGVFIEADGLWHYATFFYESMWNLIGFVILMLVLHLTKKRNGLVTSCYFIIYGVGRALIESIRTDALGYNIRVCRLLSIIMAVAGLGLLIYILVKDKKRSTLGEKTKQKRG